MLKRVLLYILISFVLIKADTLRVDRSWMKIYHKRIENTNDSLYFSATLISSNKFFWHIQTKDTVKREINNIIMVDKNEQPVFTICTDCLWGMMYYRALHKIICYEAQGRVYNVSEEEWNAVKDIKFNISHDKE